MVVICNENFKENDKYETYFNYFPNITLSNFQKWALKAIVDKEHLLITAHTGSGKTLPAEFAIQYFVSHGKKVIYTSPIKALSNTKLCDLRRKYPNISFGIVTGDITDNPDADVLIMTTEILPNTIINRKLRENNSNLQLSFINISRSLILLSEKGTLSNAPGASSFLCIDLAISTSGEIITSIGRFSLL